MVLLSANRSVQAACANADLQFAKHIKVEEQITFLKNRKTGIGVGTPARLNELIDIGTKSWHTQSQSQSQSQFQCPVSIELKLTT